jgi:hypothetical protein
LSNIVPEINGYIDGHENGRVESSPGTPSHLWYIKRYSSTLREAEIIPISVKTF